MSLRTNKRVIAAKIESSYGTDSTPAGAQAILLRNLSWTPFSGTFVNRDLIRPWLGNSPQLAASTEVKLDFEIEMAGAGSSGSVPAYDCLLRSCGFAATPGTQSITSITRVSTTATATKVAHGYLAGDIVFFSGADQTEYNGSHTILTVADADHFTFAVTGSPVTPATGTILAGTGVTYAPVSSSFASSTIYAYIDGIRQKIIGCRGNVELMLTAMQLPVFKFSMVGLFDNPSDTALLTPDYSGFALPEVANSDHTLSFSLFSYSGILQSMSFNMNNEVIRRELIGSNSVEISGRKPSGTFSIELPTISALDLFTAAEAATTGSMSITHGSVRGKQVSISAPVISLSGPSFSDDSGIAMLSVPFLACPSSGNDEVSIVIK